MEWKSPEEAVILHHHGKEQKGKDCKERKGKKDMRKPADLHA